MLCGLVYGRYAAAALHTTTKHHFNHTNTIKKALAVLIHLKSYLQKAIKMFTNLANHQKSKNSWGCSAKAI